AECLLPQSAVQQKAVSERNHSSSYRRSPGYDTLSQSGRIRRSISMKRVFIIEDDRDIVELVRYNLSNEGYQVSAAYDGDRTGHAQENPRGHLASGSHAAQTLRPRDLPRDSSRRGAQPFADPDAHRARRRS